MKKKDSTAAVVADERADEATAAGGGSPGANTTPATAAATAAGIRPASAKGFVGDPYWGRGGRYVIDPATGQRRPAQPEE